MRISGIGWLVVALGAALSASCSTNIPLPPSSTAVDVASAQQTAAEQKATLAQVAATASGLTAANVPNQKPLLQNQVGTAQAQNSQISTALGSAAKSAAKDQQVIAKAKTAPDPVVVRLEYFGFGAIVLGIIAIVAGLVFTTYLGSAATIVTDSGIVSLVSGVCAILIAYLLIPLLHALFWIILVLVGVGLVIGGVWVYIRRVAVLAWVKSLFGIKAVAPAVTPPNGAVAPVAK